MQHAPEPQIQSRGLPDTMTPVAPNRQGHTRRPSSTRRFLSSFGVVAMLLTLAAPAARAQAHAEPQSEPPPETAAQYPSLHISGFADVDFSSQRRSEGARGFSEGQFVLHLASALSPRTN